MCSTFISILSWCYDKYGGMATDLQAKIQRLGQRLKEEYNTKSPELDLEGEKPKSPSRALLGLTLSPGRKPRPGMYLCFLLWHRTCVNFVPEKSWSSLCYKIVVVTISTSTLGSFLRCWRAIKHRKLLSMGCRFSKLIFFTYGLESSLSRLFLGILRPFWSCILI